MLYQNYQTLTTFRDVSDRRFILHHGQYLDCKHVDYFHKNDPNPKIAMRLVIAYSNSTLTFRQSLAVGIRCVSLIGKMREVHIRKCEVSALLGIKLWNEVALQSSADAQFAENQRQQIYECLYKDIERNYQMPEVGPRFGNLLLLLTHLEPIIVQLMENAAMDRVFNLYKIGLWDD